MRPLAVLALAGATALGVMIASPSISALLDKYRRALKRSRRRAQQGRPTPGEAGTLDAVPTEATEDVSSTWQPPDATNLPLLGVLYDIAEDLARRGACDWFVVRFADLAQRAIRIEESCAAIATCLQLQGFGTSAATAPTMICASIVKQVTCM